MDVMTVTGPIEPRVLGHVQPHEHVLIDMTLAPYRWDYDGHLTDVSIATQELSAFRDAGGVTLVDVTTPDLGRDPEGLVEASEGSGVQIVMGTGWYREPYYPPSIDRTSTFELTVQLIAEITDGVGPHSVRPGIIGEIGTDKAWMSAMEERVFRASARAHKETGLAIMTHTPPGAATSHLALLDEEGVDLGRVAVGHADGSLDGDYHRAILDAGAFASFDLIGQGAHPDEWCAEHIAHLVELGYADQILLSSDICKRSRLRAWGGEGYPYVLRRFLPRLREVGLSAATIWQLTVGNPARLLADARLSPPS